MRHSIVALTLLLACAISFACGRYSKVAAGGVNEQRAAKPRPTQPVAEPANDAIHRLAVALGELEDEVATLKIKQERQHCEASKALKELSVGLETNFEDDERLLVEVQALRRELKREN